MNTVPNWAKAMIARGAAVLAAALLTFAADKVGVPVSDDTHKALTEVITFAGMILFVLFYGCLRPIISRFLHPNDDSRGVIIPSGDPQSGDL